MKKNIKELLTTPMKFRIPSKHEAIHKGHDILHCTYLGAATFHGGIYGWAAGGLLLIVIIGFFLGEEVA